MVELTKGAALAIIGVRRSVTKRHRESARIDKRV